MPSAFGDAWGHSPRKLGAHPPEGQGESGKAGDDPHLIDPDYDKHGGFPNFEAAEPGPGFARFLTAMRRAQDLAVSADPDSDTWDLTADRAEELVKLLGPFEAPKASGPPTASPRCRARAAC